ncbi:MAG: hypothetical protein ACE5ES_04505 [Candidatus Nanoarchaeia archaeon]
MKNQIIILIGMILILTSLVSAFGVSTPYWEGFPLTMDKGETKVVNLNLQNMVGEEDVSVKAELISGSEIAKLKKDEFEVKIGTHDTMAPLEIKIPKESPEGATNKIVVEFKTLAKEEEGVVAVGTGMTISFDVITSGKVAKANVPWTLITVIAIILVLIVIITLLIKRRKKIIENQKQLIS